MIRLTGSSIRFERLSGRNIEALARKYREDYGINSTIEAVVREIIKYVVERGDRALIECTEKLDGVKLRAEELKVDVKDFQDAYQEVSEEQITSLELIKERIEEVERLKLEKANGIFTTREGISIQYTFRPIENVGCYAPGGRAWYPSHRKKLRESWKY